MRAADVVDGVVVNVIEVESLPAPELDPLVAGNLVECPDFVAIGWAYDPAKVVNQWEPPPEPELPPGAVVDVGPDAKPAPE